MEKLLLNDWMWLHSMLLLYGTLHSLLDNLVKDDSVHYYILIDDMNNNLAVFLLIW